MAQVLFGFQLAIEVAFALLAIRTIVSWVQQPDRRHGHLAIALGSLATVILVSNAFGSPGLTGQAATDVAVALFLASGYGLLMFRDTFVPFQPVTRRLVTAAIVVVAALAIVVELPASLDRPHTTLQSLLVVAILGLWSYCILDPIVSFWIVSRRRPAVEKARLRALSIGYAGLLVVIIVGTVAGSVSDAFSLVLDFLALAIVPILYVAFFPPPWLRRVWRQPEEDQFRLALHDLLLYSPDRATLADRALGWAERLVGGDAAFVIDGDGSVLAALGVSKDEAGVLGKRITHRATPPDGSGPWREDGSIVVPLDLRQGPGAMVITTGRLSPIFGDDELGRLRQYATSIIAGLDRVTLNERIAGLERAKTDFLNIASHELRGPMTVIKGYLTMLDSGAMGDMPAKARSVLPLLISKSDEVNWMIEQMIEASRLEEGRLALKRRPADVVELTEDAIDSVRILLSGHDVKADYPPHAVDAVVDPDRFQIVVRNLLSNAAKYSTTGSDIEVDVKRDGDKALVSVRDHGVGISAEDQKTLFTRFVRLETSAHVQGTGLGLWLSREIALMHDGNLTVDSTPGQGSTFTLSVPLTK
ncbi:MAG TPA: HAMP domain-containing sensor histidine kinase [Candidatus Dormibacteraeota bacterium]|nr:HAMP domain-containing sensor histidine kinase [Candidatus Dormibacteraeota bacterium]